MDDIVDRLQRVMQKMHDYSMPPRYAHDVHHAIHEIVRLRAAGDQLAAAYHTVAPLLQPAAPGRPLIAWQEARHGRLETPK